MLHTCPPGFFLSPVLLILLSKQDVFSQCCIQDPGLLSHIGKPSSDSHTALQQSHLSTHQTNCSSTCSSSYVEDGADWLRGLGLGFLVNGSVLDVFPLSRVTRLPSPLYYLHYAQATCRGYQDHQELSGVKLGDTEHIILLYADDVLLFITSPEHQIPILLSLINQSGLISAYEMNYNKSEAMPLADSGDWVSLANFPFRWSTVGFTYLGIRVSADIKELYKLNFKATLKSVKNDLHWWFDRCLGPAELV